MTTKGFSTPIILPAALVAMLLLFSLDVTAQSAAGPLVKVSGGTIQGLAVGSAGAVFKGVPFAQPPVGNLRWREPQPVKAWTGVRPARDYGSPCMQLDTGWNKNSAARASEDCLYLNIWAPEWPAKTKHAVMVWLHGGGNTGGSSLGAGGIEPPFDGAALASHGVVVVTINYRLGIFGFVGHPELMAESPHHASGAYGILDQIAALQWVHDNIAVFGGDPTNVTLFGQSAGSRDSTIVEASPLSKGLVQKGIAESGSPMSSDRRLETPAQVEQAGTVLAEVLKAPATGQIAFLRTIPAAQIIAVQRQFAAELEKRGLSLDVGMDGYAIPEYTAEVYRSGKEPALPMIFGSNGRDNVSQHIGEPNDTPEQRLAAVRSAVEHFWGKYPDLLARALKSYGFSGTDSDVSTYPPYGPAEIQLGTDLSQRCNATIMSGWHSAIAPTYEYEFDAGNEKHAPYHSAELDFVFGYLRDQASDPALVKLSGQMEEYWTNFAKTGDPNGPGLPKWPKYDAAGHKYLQLANDGITERAALRNVQCGIYAERLNRELDARKQK